MAKGQLTYLNLVNRTLQRLGKPQVSTLVGVSSGTDSWVSFVADAINDAQAELYKEHDWSTLWTSGTFSTSSRTYDLSSSFSGFGRAIDLVDTTNRRVLTEVMPRDMDELDPVLTTSGTPTAFTIEYPNLLFNWTPSASTTYRLRYLTRPTTLSGNSSTSDLPEYADWAMIFWAYWQLMATREDASDGGAGAYRLYTECLQRAIAQDRKRVDRLWRLQPAFARTDLALLAPLNPSHYPAG